ncbi:hypothetical protein [Mycobacterium spongiae]|uniref:Uncharacterized protein n=1 Tax=Mycobacterium spongiae TaxID=886343 RepID=A0A975JXD0_9MYCO|nr:hypothetical protein [Mycobacterium spongiae]QUR67113.1 hypothetical protein F6B93_08375 [Mycobacterium spongiae]
MATGSPSSVRTTARPTPMATSARSMSLRHCSVNSPNRNAPRCQQTIARYCSGIASVKASGNALGTYLTPKKPTAADPNVIRSNGRGIAYTRTAFAYLFRLTEAIQGS